MEELCLLPWLRSEPWGNKAWTSAPGSSQEVWETEKLLLSLARWIRKGARKLTPSVTWVSNKSDTAALGAAASPIHLRGVVNPETPPRFSLDHTVWGCGWPYLLAGLQDGTQSLAHAHQGLAGGGRGRGVEQNLAPSLGKEPSLLPRHSSGLGWRPDLLPSQSSLCGHWLHALPPSPQPQFINLHFVEQFQPKKKTLKRLKHGILVFSTCNGLISLPEICSY